MKEHKLKLVAMFLAFVGVLAPNQVFADTAYRHVPAECYTYFETIYTVGLVSAPVGCIIEIGRGIVSIHAYDREIVAVRHSVTGGFTMELKSLGATGIDFELSDGGEIQGVVIAMDIQSNTPSIINNTVKQYLMDNFGHLSSSEITSVCSLTTYSCRVYLNLDIENISEDLLDDENILAYGNISLEIRGRIGNTIESVDNFGEYTVDVLWEGLDLSEPADGRERNFYVIRLSDGEKIPAEVDNDGNLVFPTTKFGTFAVAYEDTDPEDAEPEGVEPEGVKTEESSGEISVPNTGVDAESTGNTILSIAGCIAAGIGLSLVMFSKVKKYTKR